MSKIIEKFKKFLDYALATLEERTNQLENQCNEEPCECEFNDCCECHECCCNDQDEQSEYIGCTYDDPIALDVFGNYLYMHDSVIPVAYNDKRLSYISIKKDYVVEDFTSVNGPIYKNVLKLSVFKDLDSRGLVSIADKSKYYHVKRLVKI